MKEKLINHLQQTSFFFFFVPLIMIAIILEIDLPK